jgi:hypothetical protein
MEPWVALRRSRNVRKGLKHSELAIHHEEKLGAPRHLKLVRSSVVPWVLELVDWRWDFEGVSCEIELESRTHSDFLEVMAWRDGDPVMNCQTS